MMSRLSGALVALAAATPVAAQDNAVRAAADAFGERVGIEQSGLYNEGQVRGFDLQASGSYRIGDAYFSRASPLNDPVAASVGVRVGVSAAGLTYPAPSGVVVYRLREPAETNQLSLGAGLRPFGTRTLEANGSWQDADGRFGVSGGVILRPVARFSSGERGRALDIGAVGRWRVADGHIVRAFYTAYQRDYDGDYAMQAADAAVPPSARALHSYAPEWAKVVASSLNMGVLYEGRVGPWSLDASAFRSIYDTNRSDFSLLSVRANGDVTATAVISPGKTTQSDSAEARVSRTIRTGPLTHLLSASVRARRSETDLASTLSVPLGAFTLATDPAPSVRPVWSGTRGLDVVEQVIGSLGYGVTWDDRLQVRLGLNRSRHDKQVLALTGARTRGVDVSTFYNASAVLRVTPRTSVFGSWVTGLEGVGVSPITATNPLEVLDPVKAEQLELGVRHALTPSITLIGALFDVSRPTTGFRADGSFGLVGRQTHRGVEASLAGQLDGKTSVVLGAVRYDPRVSGPLVDAGVVGPHAVGISDLVINGNIERQLGAGWSADVQVIHGSGRFVDSRNTFSTPDYTLFNVGARHRFEVGGRAAQFRVVASNITNSRGYAASSASLLYPASPRTVRAMLTVTLGPKPR